MENIEKVDVDSFYMIDRTEREEQDIANEYDTYTAGYHDINTEPGHFSYDVLQQKFGINEDDLLAINGEVGGYRNYNNDSFPRVVTGNKRLQEYTVRYAFESSGLLVDPEILRPLIEKLKFIVRETDGRLQAEFKDTKVKGKNFFMMDQNGNIEYFTKSSRTEYKKDSLQRHKMKIDYLKGYGIDKQIISDIEANDVLNKTRRLERIRDAKEKKEAAQSLVLEIGESSINRLDENDTPNTEKQSISIKHIKNELVKFVNGKVETNIDNEGVGNVEIDNEEFTNISLRAAIDELEETMPLKLRLKNIVKQHGITIASVTVMVGTIITSIATSLSNSASSVATTDSSIKEEVEKLKEKNEELKKDEIKNKDEIEKNDKKIKELEDKINNKKSIWEYVKQVAKYILTGFTTLLSLIGKVIGFLGKLLMGLGWVVYVVIAAVAALAYGYYENKRD